MSEGGKGKRWVLRAWSREAVLLTAIASVVILFGLTDAAVEFYRNEQTQLAKVWFQKGNDALAAKRASAAVDDFRNAVNYASDNTTYQFRLAQALAAANQIDEAESYLLDLWSSEPGNGEINLELARLEARKNDPDAARYYNNAIYGIWYGINGENPLERRWDARMELFRYWFDHGNIPQAQGVLLALAANVAPNDYARLTLVGQLQLKADDAQHALQEFLAALRANRRYGPALAGAGAAQFSLGQYEAAIPDLEAAVRLNRNDHEARSQLAMARLVLDSDPFGIRLDDAQRAERSVDAYLQALSELSLCASAQGVTLDSSAAQNQDPLQQAWMLGQSQAAAMTGFRGQSPSVLQLMSFVFSAENLAASECGPLQGKDEALWLIGKMHQLPGSGAQAAD